MKNLLTLTLLASALALTACGGSSNSSGGVNGISSLTSTKSEKPSEKPSEKKGSCRVKNNVINIQEGGSCTYSSESLNSGALLTYTCSVGKVSNGTIVATTIKLNDLKFQCAS